MTGLRVTLPLVVSVVVGMLGACAGATAGAPAASPSKPPPPPPSGPSSAPPIADTDMDEARVCLLVPVAFRQPNAHLRAAAGRPAPEVAAGLEDAVARSRSTVDDAPDGGVRSAGEALLAEATRLAARLRAGEGSATLDHAWAALDDACGRS